MNLYSEYTNINHINLDDIIKTDIMKDYQHLIFQL